MEYIEYVSGNISNRSIFIKKSTYNEIIKNASKIEYYKSIFTFSEKVNETTDFTLLTAGIDEIWFDFDKKGNETDKHLLERVRNFVNYLIKNYGLEDLYEVYFSGNGFHVKIPDIFGFEPSNDIHLIVKETLYHHFKEYKIDTKIYHKRGLIRGEYSYNAETSLYKNKLTDTLFWLKDIDEIREYCKVRRYEKINKLEYDGDKFIIIKPFNKIDHRFITEPSNIVTCMQKMYNVGEQVGTRHERVLRLASWLMRNGVPFTGAMNMLKGYTPTLPYDELERTVANVYEKKYMYSCNDRVMSEFCDPKCIFYKKKNYLPEIYGASNLELHYRDMISKDIYKHSINLKNLLNLEEDYHLLPGNVIGIIGDTGVNKSALLQNIAVKLTSYEPILYVNTEMSEIEFYERFLMIAYDKTKEEIREHYKYNDNTLGNVIRHIVFTSTTPSWEGLVDIIQKIRPKILIVDVIDDIFTQKLTLKDEEKQYMEIKNLSKLYNIITFLVHHISKGRSDDLTKHSGKGSSAFEQKADVVIGIKQLNHIIREILTLKSRGNKPFKAYFEIDDKFIFRNYYGINESIKR